MESLAESTIETWMYGKEEVQLVDMVLRIRAKLSEAASQKMPLPDIVKERLEKHVSTIVKTLPSDLQTVLQKGTILNVDKNSNSSSNSSESKAKIGDSSIKDLFFRKNEDRSSPVTLRTPVVSKLVWVHEGKSACNIKKHVLQKKYN